MVWAVLHRRYPFPWKTFIVALLCAVYVISPIDLLPDVLPLLGITDDITFLLLVLAMIREEIAKFRTVRNTFGAPPSKDADVIDVGDFKDHKK